MTLSTFFEPWLVKGVLPQTHKSRGNHLPPLTDFDAPVTPAETEAASSNPFFNPKNKDSIENALQGFIQVGNGEVRLRLAQEVFDTALLNLRNMPDDDPNKSENLQKISSWINRRLSLRDLLTGSGPSIENISLGLYVQRAVEDILPPNDEIKNSAKKVFPSYCSASKIEMSKIMVYADAFKVDTDGLENGLARIIETRQWERFERFKMGYPEIYDIKNQKFISAIKEAILHAKTPDEVLEIRKKFPGFTDGDFHAAIQDKYTEMIVWNPQDISSYEKALGIEVDLTNEKIKDMAGKSLLRLTNILKGELPDEKFTKDLEALQMILSR